MHRAQSTSRRVATVGAGLVAAGIIVCGSSDAETAPRTPDRSATTTAAGHATDVLAARRALATAARRVAHGRPYDLEQSTARRRRVWDVKVASGRKRPYELLVSADGRRVTRTTRAEKLGDDAPTALTAHVSLATAVRTATERSRGVALSEAEVDRTRSGAVVWQVTFQNPRQEIEVTVSARSGTIVSVTRGDSDD